MTTASSELTAGYHERSRVQTFLQTGSAIGLMLTLLLPAILDQFSERGAFEKIAAMGAFAIATFVPSVFVLLFFFRDGKLVEWWVESDCGGGCYSMRANKSSYKNTNAGLSDCYER